MNRSSRQVNAYRRDILRTITRNRRRFISIAIIAMLGVMMFSALAAATEDLRRSSDTFYDAQHLHDLSVVSTLGLDDEDLKAISQLPETEHAEGIRTAEANISTHHTIYSITFETMPSQIDVPYVRQGRLPQKKGEAAVTWKTAADTGLKVGDTIYIQKDEDNEEDVSLSETPSLNSSIFTITGIVIDPSEINNPSGSMSYRMDSIKDRAFVLDEDLNSTVYSQIHITLTGAENLYCYSDEYEKLVSDAKHSIETLIQKNRQNARTKAVRQDAQDQISSSEDKLNEKLDDARREIEDGQKKLDDSKADGERKLSSADAELSKNINDAKQKLFDGQASADARLNEAYSSLSNGEAQIITGQKQLNEGQEELNRQSESALKTLDDAQKQLDEQQRTLSAELEKISTSMQEITAQNETLISSFDDWPVNLWNTYIEQCRDAYIPVISAQMGPSLPEVSYEKPDSSALDAWIGSRKAALEALMQSADESSKTQIEAALSALESADELAEGYGKLQASSQVLNDALSKIEEGQSTLQVQKEAALDQLDAAQDAVKEGQRKLDASRVSLAEGWNDYYSGKSEAEQEITESWKQLNDAYEDGLAQIADGRKELEESLKDGQKKIDDARAELESAQLDAQQQIDNLKEQISEIKPAQWYLYDRTSLESYSDLKSDADSIEAIGNVFPILFLAVAILICLTAVTRMIDEDRGLIGTYKSLGYTRSEIMKKYLWFALTAGVSGSLIGTILAFAGLPSFIIVIFRIMYALPDYALYFLPVKAAAGAGLFCACIAITAVTACRKVLAETPASLMRPKAPKAGSKVFLERFRSLWLHLSFLDKVTARNIFRYKGRMLMTIIGIAGCMAILLFGFAIRDSVHDLNGRQYGGIFHYNIMAVCAFDDNDQLKEDLSNNEVLSYLNIGLEQVTLQYQDTSISAQLMVLPDNADLSDYISLTDTHGNPLTLNDGAVYVTRNASNILGFASGDTVSMQKSSLEQINFEVSAVVSNYLSNYVYMNASTYEKLSGTFEPDAALVILKDGRDERAFADMLKGRDEILSVVSAEKLLNDFSGTYLLIDAVVYIIVIMSAALAFTVLFTLSTTNICERQRELATIKVLGFYDREVHAYVNKETWILTILGIIAGIPLGYAFAQTLTTILNLPSMYLAVSLHLSSYLICIALTVLFAAAVMQIMNKTIDAINPVAALKSVE